MKLRKLYMYALAGLTTIAGFGSCSDELDLSPNNPQSSNTSFNESEVFAKVYATLALTGQSGGSGNPDISSQDEGRGGWYRRVFEANEYATDECIWTWQGDPSIAEFTNPSWSASTTYNEVCYNRLSYNVTACNLYLDETSGSSDATILQHRAEVRFLRSLFYYNFLEIYHKAPFKESVSSELPVQKDSLELFNYIESELKAVAGETESSEVLANAPTSASNFGHADKAAAWLLLSRLYLNSQEFTGVAHWQEAYDYANKVINESGYKLCTTSLNGYTPYERLFMADNDENSDVMQEIIFPVRQDGVKTRSYCGSSFIILSCRQAGMPDYGSTDAWTCIRSREGLVKIFFPDLSKVPFTEDVKKVQEAAGDDRALFYSGAAGGNQRTIETKEKSTFASGLGIVKWTNVRADGQSASDQNFADTDIPLFRVAEAYLTRAEASWRLNNQNETAQALSDINTLRSRAGAAQIEAGKLTERDIIDEWAKEFYLEGRRRVDLIRFNMFSGNKYLWDWKGGSYEGTSFNSTYNVFPIPTTDLNLNENMRQNAGY